MEPPCLHTAAYNVVCDRSLCTRKYHAIRQNSRGKWLTFLSPFTTFTTCLSVGSLNSRLATSVSMLFPWLPCTSINMISTHSRCEREGDGGLLRDSAQAFSNVFFSQSKCAFLSNLLMSLQLRNIRFQHSDLCYNNT